MTHHSNPVRPGAALVSALIVLAVSGCSGLNRENDRYLEAETGNPLSVPPDLTRVSPSQDELAATAAAAGASAEEREEYARFQRLQDFEEYERYQRFREQLGEPEELSYEAFLAEREQASRAEQERQGVVFLRGAGGERRLHVYDDLDDTWIRVGDALASMGLDIVRQSRDTGTYTIIVPEGDDSGSLWTFWRRARAERDVALSAGDRGTFVAIVGDGEAIDVEPGANDVLARLADQLRLPSAADPQSGPTTATGSTPAAARPDGARLELGESGFQQLEIDAPVERAWERIEYTLDEAGFTVESRDRPRGVFLIRYIPESSGADKEGVLQRLAFWRDDGDSVETRYQIQLEGEGNQTVVRVYDGQSRQNATGDRILRILHEQLI